MVAGENFAVMPWGSPLVARVTAALNPLRSAICTVIGADDDADAVSELALRVSLIEGDVFPLLQLVTSASASTDPRPLARS